MVQYDNTFNSSSGSTLFIILRYNTIHERQRCTYTYGHRYQNLEILFYNIIFVIRRGRIVVSSGRHRFEVSRSNRSASVRLKNVSTSQPRRTRGRPRPDHKRPAVGGEFREPKTRVPYALAAQ